MSVNLSYKLYFLKLSTKSYYVMSFSLCRKLAWHFDLPNKFSQLKKFICVKFSRFVGFGAHVELNQTGCEASVGPFTANQNQIKKNSKIEKSSDILTISYIIKFYFNDLDGHKHCKCYVHNKEV